MIKKLLNDYTNSSFCDDKDELAIKSMKNFIHKNSVECFNRKNMNGHFTASSWIVDESLENVLLIFHPIHNKWLQPGGHIDINETPIETAIREAEEEIGVKISLFSSKLFATSSHSVIEVKEKK
jgi:hypothetical protein